ncbi:MAG: hypothetical protein K0R51_428 [Cytophagaceae bacterium]|jgi:hypothetical protein|nr:hypothetical protein [Cytophagaceae bacterium]
MDIQTLKSQHKELFDKVFAEGVAAERERVDAWLTVSKGNPSVVVEGINSGKKIPLSLMMNLTKKTKANEDEISAFNDEVKSSINLKYGLNI